MACFIISECTDSERKLLVITLINNFDGRLYNTWASFKDTNREEAYFVLGVRHHRGE